MTLRKHGGRIDYDDREDSDISQDEEPDREPTSEPLGKKAKVTKRPEPDRSWKREDIDARKSDRFTWNGSKTDTSRFPQNPVEIFELFLDDEMMDAIVEFSTLYAAFKGNTSLKTTRDEMRVFIAILLLSGYNQLPRRRLYWSHDHDVRNESVSSAITRDRLDVLMRYTHLSDNTRLDAMDKMAKVRPFFNMLNERFLRYFVQRQHLSIDESMVPYYGRHGAKQFIRGKPIRWGYNIWVLTTSHRYAIQFEPYQGAARNKPDVAGLGMGGEVIVDLISELDSGIHYHLTFDNLFSSLPLIEHLSGRGIGCTRTVRANRLRNCPIKDDKTLKKAKRGTYDYSYEKNSGTILVQWNDNSVMNIVSNTIGVHPVQPVKRWSRADKQRVDIDQQALIKQYNQTMGGVDRMDQNISKYRISIRSKKWWWPLFAYGLDLCVQQAWLLYRDSAASVDNPLDLLGIRREIVKVHLARATKPQLGRPCGRPAQLSKRVPDVLRLDRTDHLVQKLEKQIRCAQCGKKTLHYCRKCNVGVHDKCFVKFHE